MLRVLLLIFAIRAGARGDITLDDSVKQSESILWSKVRRGPYMPTPLIYDDLVFTLNNNGVFDCYRLQTGEELIRERIKHAGGGFSASPVAADGKLYLSSEDGEITVVKAASTLEVLAKNNMGEVLMATPAISEGVLYVVRGISTLFAISR